jgi:hypothetical protein
MAIAHCRALDNPPLGETRFYSAKHAMTVCGSVMRRSPASAARVAFDMRVVPALIPCQRNN